jgi:hypothetical protein
VSLAQLDPAALVRLKVTGTCEFEIPEAYFDVDRPGHFRRRLRSVSMSVQLGASPYAPIHATITLLRSSERTNDSVAGGYVRARDAEGAWADDPRFADVVGAPESIVTSGTHEDFGLFEPQLSDPHRLPFDRRGVISRWRLELPATFSQVDYVNTADVVLHLRYTARDGGARLAGAAVAALRDEFNDLLGRGGERGLARLFSLRHEFSGWQRLLATGGERTLSLDVADRFPYLVRGRPVTVTAIDLLLRGRAPFADADIGRLRAATLGGMALDGLSRAYGRTDVLGFHRDGLTWNPRATVWTFDVGAVVASTVALLEDAWLVCRYEVEVDSS